MLLMLLAMGCQNDEQDSAVLREAAPVTEPTPETMRRLTSLEYHNIITDLFGGDVVVDGRLEEDERIEGLYAVGSTWTTISSYGVEKFETAAYDIAEQILTTESTRQQWLTCEPVDVQDDDCAAAVLETLGRQIWRRPLTAEELDGLVSVSALAAVTLDDFEAGLEYGIAALLMSPHFLYRPELGDGGALDDYAFASRLSFFLWDSAPDAALLQAAEAGELSSESGLADQVSRMIDDERAVRGVQAFFAEMLHLDELDDLSKDPTIFVYMSDELGASAKQETLLSIEDLVFTRDASYLELFTTQQTYVDRTLAALYAVQSPTQEGFGPVTMTKEDGRRGLLGQASMLLPNAHAVSTSATLRGIFVREMLLCQIIPDPPADANTAIPEVSADAPTMRERIAVHLEDPFCASCHSLTDPIGLGLENFDGLGRWRLEENGVRIDPSGELDGMPFADAWELGDVVASHPATSPCLIQTMMQYATGNLVEDLDEDLLNWYTDGFVDAQHRVLWLMQDIALSDAFRQAQDPEVEQ